MKYVLDNKNLNHMIPVTYYDTNFTIKKHFYEFKIH